MLYIQLYIKFAIVFFPTIMHTYEGEKTCIKIIYLTHTHTFISLIHTIPYHSNAFVCMYYLLVLIHTYNIKLM